MKDILYDIERVLTRVIGGHINIGPVTIFGFNAMMFTTQIWSNKFGYICIRPTTYFRGRWWRWYIYISPNGTPWASTFAIGPGVDKPTKVTASIRRYCFGHNYVSSDEVINWNREIRDKFEYIHMINVQHQEEFRQAREVAQ